MKNIHKQLLYAVMVPLLLGTLLLKLRSVVSIPEAPLTADWNTTLQSIDGFGASATGYTGTISAEQGGKFFDASTGLGLSLLRIRAIADTVGADCECVANNAPYSCVAGTKSQIVTGDLQVAQLAASHGVRLFVAPWSPPAAMKSSGSYCKGGSMIGNSGNYAAYAADLGDFIGLLSSKGLPIFAISIQNEPDIENPYYDTCSWTAQQIHDFVPYLWNALSAAGFAGIKIALPEESVWTFDRLSLTLNDPPVAQRIGLILGHGYASANPTAMPNTNGLPVWQSEVSGSESFDGSMLDAITWARHIHNYMTLGANAWMYWQLDCGPAHFNQANNMCLTNQKGDFAKRAYVLGQFAKFVRPGWHRVALKNSGSLLATAYKGPGGKFAIVAINASRWFARDQEFILNGIKSQHSPVMPWITSETRSLASQKPVSLSSDGTTFKYSIPANSVVTFAGQAD